MNDIKGIIAKNIMELRQANAMTQLELANKLNYSDKAVSKWEHADSMPDISVLVEIADLFGVSLDYLVRDNHNVTVEDHQVKKPAKYSRKAITAISLSLVWLVVSIVFVALSLWKGRVGWHWICFVYAIPVQMILLLVFNSIWFNPRKNYHIITILMWSLLLSIHLTLLIFDINVWIIYLLGIPGQIIILFWSVLKKSS